MRGKLDRKRENTAARKSHGLGSWHAGIYCYARIEKKGRLVRIDTKIAYAEMVNFRNDGLLIDDRTVCYL